MPRQIIFTDMGDPCPDCGSDIEWEAPEIPTDVQEGCPAMGYCRNDRCGAVFQGPSYLPPPHHFRDDDDDN